MNPGRPGTGSPHAGAMGGAGRRYPFPGGGNGAATGGATGAQAPSIRKGPMADNQDNSRSRHPRTDR